MGRLGDGWRAYREATADIEAGYMRDMTPLLVIVTFILLALGEWVGAAILAPAALVGVSYLWRHRRRNSN